MFLVSFGKEARLSALDALISSYDGRANQKPPLSDYHRPASSATSFNDFLATVIPNIYSHSLRKVARDVVAHSQYLGSFLCNSPESHLFAPNRHRRILIVYAQSCNSLRPTTDWLSTAAYSTMGSK